MAHQRQVIGEAIVALLTGQTTAGARVYLNRVEPLRSKEIPAVVVYVLGEKSEHGDTAPRELKRELSVDIEALVLLDDSAASTLNDIAQAIETAMSADPSLDGEAGDSYLTGTDIAISQEGEQLLMSATLFYSVVYHTLAPEATADGDMDDFETVGAEHELVGEPDVFTVEDPYES